LKLIVEKVKGFGRVRQPPLPSLIEFESLLVIRIMILRGEESSDLEPLYLRYMEQLKDWRGRRAMVEGIGAQRMEKIGMGPRLGIGGTRDDVIGLRRHMG